MKIHAERIAADLDRIAAITDTPGHGSGRPTFTPQWAEARDYVIAEAKSVGCEVRIDFAGNVHIRQAAFGWTEPAWLSGSHIDSVPHGGKYDGVTGIVVPLELFRAAAETSKTIPLELVIFAEEEGTTFNLGMLGSRAWAGTLTRDDLAKLKNKAGVDPLTAGEPFGVVAEKIGVDRINSWAYRGLIEVHVEQGPAMWETGMPVSIVTAINGRRQFAVTVTGTNNHAGSTPMNYRQDALAGFAEMHVALEQLPSVLGPHTVLTVGIVNAQPNAINVINGTVNFTIDFRAPDDATLDHGTADIEAIVLRIAERRKLTIDFKQTEALPAVTLDQDVIGILRRAVTAAGLTNVGSTVSGALHDAAILAPIVPTAMIFVASRDGISHNPGEFSRTEDIAQAAELLAAVVTTPLTVDELNAASVADVVRALGHLFEHSPWVAERAAAKRPFASVGAVHFEMVDAVEKASEAEQLALIRAHPDLVGRLAREGRLTHESNAEQAAAGLSALSVAEVEQFEKYNAAYRAKFDFPFIIFARGNTKQSILEAFPVRLQNTREAEIATALDEIFKIARYRQNSLLGLA